MDSNEVSKSSELIFTEEELHSLENRWKEYKANPGSVKTWEEVKSAILLKINIQAQPN
jgi:hypothetical protein